VAEQSRSARYAPSVETSALPGIREYLKQWQIHNGADIIGRQPAVRTKNHRTNVENTGLPGQSYHDLATDEEQSQNEFDSFRPFLKDDLVDVGGQRTFLLPGDMVELM
jgi:hypothetical protein